MLKLASSRRTVAEYLTHHPKTEGSNPATGIGREIMAKKSVMPGVIMLNVIAPEKLLGESNLL